MTVALIVLCGQNAPPLVSWVGYLTSMLQQDLLLICPQNLGPASSRTEVARREDCPAELAPLLDALKPFKLAVAQPLRPHARRPGEPRQVRSRHRRNLPSRKRAMALGCSCTSYLFLPSTGPVGCWRK